MTPLDFEHDLDNRLREDISSAEQRQLTAFDSQAAPLENELVLFGAGGLGRKTLAGLQQLGRTPLAFADNNPQLWNTAIEGVPVLSPADAARYCDRATFVVTIWRAGGGHRFAHSRKQLRDLGCGRVVSFAHLYWKHADVFLPYYCLDRPHRVLADAEAVRAAGRLWHDSHSRREYLAQVRWRLLLDFDGLPNATTEEQYFPELFRWKHDEVFVDCGAFDGDTIRNIMKRFGAGFCQIHAFEPDPINFSRLREFVVRLPAEVRSKLKLYSLATSNHRNIIRFEASGSASSRMGVGSIEVECAPLDELLADVAPTFVKMDIEGAEPGALEGAAKLIERCRPILAICVYHAQDHLWRLPLWIHSRWPDYRFFLRPHNEECWDLVCYAIPVHRLRLPCS